MNSFDPSDLVGLLTLGLHDAGVYFPEHARVQATASRVAEIVEGATGTTEGASIFLGVVDGRLVHAGKFLLGPTLIAKRLIDAALRLRSGGFLFRHGVSGSELTAFFGVCTAVRTKCESLDDARRLLRSRGVFGVELSPPFGAPGWLGSPDLPREDVVAAEVVRTLGGSVPAFQRLRQAVEESHAAAERDREVDVPESRETVESLIASLTENPSEVMYLSRYPDYASYTVGHSVRVALLAMMVGRHLGLDERVLVELGTAGLLHDVGKSKIPHEVLFKRGRLDDAERKVISTHPTIGARILLSTRDAPPMGVAAAFGHHLRHDRKGYPSIASWGVAGHVTALVQVCDVFEALTAVRPYKPSLSARRAYEIMAADHGAFLPGALAAFVAAIGFYPPGSRVRLRSGEEAMVRRVSRDAARPLVELSRDASGRALPAADRMAIDLSDEPTGSPREIEEVLAEHDGAGRGPDEERAVQALAEAAATAASASPEHDHPPGATPSCCHEIAKAVGESG